MQWQKFKKLDYLVSQSDQADCCVVLFHGYGADAQDLASLSTCFQFKENVDWYFPQGFLQVPIGPMMSGRAWFELRVSDFDQNGQFNAQNIPVGEAEEKVFNQVSEWLNHLGKLYKKVIIGGFSQGAILTSHCFYRLNFSPKALVLYSGYLVAGDRFPILPDPLKIPFFQSHGRQDPVLAIGGAQALFKKLQELGLKGQWSEFNGGHEIPMGVIAQTQTFLTSVLEPQE